jgi:VCBS repeat-containing protein
VLDGLGPLADNQPPVAVDDAYTGFQSDELVIPATEGVLLNDSDPEGDPLAAVLETGPQHGALTLEADGSFTYTPEPGYVGPDTFTYRASDGLLESDLATVTIDVISPATVTGTVYRDSNGDSLRDPGELGLTGWVVFADYDLNGVQDAGEHSVVTDGDGGYILTLLPTACEIAVVD